MKEKFLAAGITIGALLSPGVASGQELSPDATPTTAVSDDRGMERTPETTTTLTTVTVLDTTTTTGISEDRDLERGAPATTMLAPDDRPLERPQDRIVVVAPTTTTASDDRRLERAPDSTITAATPETNPGGSLPKTGAGSETRLWATLGGAATLGGLALTWIAKATRDKTVPRR